jgi:hypothetical protein
VRLSSEAGFDIRGRNGILLGVCLIGVGTERQMPQQEEGNHGAQYSQCRTDYPI